MDAKQFLSEFRHIATAPGGVDRLREMILSLAFQGTLSEHAPEDVTGLLSALDRQRANPPRESGKSRKRTIAAARSVQPPFAIPEHWRWLSLSEIGHGWGQKTPRTDFTYIDVSSIDNRLGTLREPLTVLTASQAPSRARKIVRRGTVIYSTVRPYLLNIALIDRDFEQEPIASTAFAVVHPWKGILPKYVYYYLRCPFFIAYVQSVQIGMAYPAISDEKFFAGLIPLPPSSEQERIVTKIDELLALCDRLEAQQQQREALCKRARIAVLNSLSISNTAHSLSSAWRRLQLEVPLLLEQSSDVADFRALILDLAATGRLSEPLSGDSKAEELVEEAKASRVRRLAAGEMKNKNISPTDIKEIDITTPSHWAKASLEELFLFIDYRGKTPIKTTSGRVLITAKNVRPGRISPDPVEHISETSYQEWMTRGFPSIGDLLITTEAPLGNVAQINEEPQFALAQRVINLHPYARMNTRFFMYFMMSPSFQSLLWENATGTTAKGIKAAKLKRLKLSVPPLEEQERIVARTAKLLSICNELELQLNNSRLLAGQLASACTAAITGIRIEGQEKMKVPKTEVVSTLRIGISPTNKEQAPLASILVRNQGELPAKTLWGSSGLEIEDFYQQLRNEMAKGWIVQPEAAYVREVEAG